MVLLQIYLRPDELDARAGVFRDAAMRILKLHASKLDAVRVLDMLPSDIMLVDVQPFLEQVCSRLAQTWCFFSPRDSLARAACLLTAGCSFLNVCLFFRLFRRPHTKYGKGCLSRACTRMRITE